MSSDSRSGWDALGGLYALLAQHDALGGHALARKSVRSPSRRLRFGRRSDPDMPPQAPVSILQSKYSTRLKFKRRLLRDAYKLLENNYCNLRGFWELSS